MQQQQEGQGFSIAEARRVLDDVFAPWVKDLDLAVEAFDFEPPADARDWQAGAVLRMPFSEKLCRNGGMVCGQALMAFADTAMVIAEPRGQSRLPADDDGRPDHAFHARGDVLRRARRCARRPPRSHHELWPCHAAQCRRQETGGDGLERVRDAVLKTKKPTPFEGGPGSGYRQNKTNDRPADCFSADNFQPQITCRGLLRPR